MYYNNFFTTASSANTQKMLKMIVEIVSREAITELTFDYLKVIAPTGIEKRFLQSMLDEERQHIKELKKIYFSITGQKIEGESPLFEAPESFIDGITDIYYRKVEVIAIYKKIKKIISTSTSNAKIIETFFDFIDDELKHLSMLNHMLIKSYISERLQDYQIVSNYPPPNYYV